MFPVAVIAGNPVRAVGVPAAADTLVVARQPAADGLRGTVRRADRLGRRGRGCRPLHRASRWACGTRIGRPARVVPPLVGCSSRSAARQPSSAGEAHASSAAGASAGGAAGVAAPTGCCCCGPQPGPGWPRWPAPPAGRQPAAAGTTPTAAARISGSAPRDRRPGPAGTAGSPNGDGAGRCPAAPARPAGVGAGRQGSRDGAGRHAAERRNRPRPGTGVLVRATAAGQLRPGRTAARRRSAGRAAGRAGAGAAVPVAVGVLVAGGSIGRPVGMPLAGHRAVDRQRIAALAVGPPLSTPPALAPSPPPAEAGVRRRQRRAEPGPGGWSAGRCRAGRATGAAGRWPGRGPIGRGADGADRAGTGGRQRHRVRTAGAAVGAGLPVSGGGPPTVSSARGSNRLASTSIGIRTNALTPPVSDWRSRTVMPCRVASRPTTYRPIIRETETSNSGGMRQPLVGVGDLVRAHADAAVLDLDHGAAVGQPLAVHQHLGLGRGEDGRVLQQLGDQVDEVVDRVAHHLDVRDAGQLDAVVLLHLGGGRPQHVDQRDRPAPPAAGVLTGEDQQVLRVAPHAGGEVVQLEQVGQLVRVLLAGLQLVDQLELALDQALRPAGEVDEHVVDVAAQAGLLGRQPTASLVQLVEGPGDVADLVPGVDPDGFDLVRCRWCVRSLQSRRSPPAAGPRRRPGRRPAAGAAGRSSSGR